jgi:anti-sigma factor RsiW
MITCRELAEFLDDYIAGQLDPQRAGEFERHLLVCPTCVKYLNTYRQTIALGKAAFADEAAPAPADVPPNLIRAILAAAPKINAPR